MIDAVTATRMLFMVMQPRLHPPWTTSASPSRKAFESTSCQKNKSAVSTVAFQNRDGRKNENNTLKLTAKLLVGPVASCGRSYWNEKYNRDFSHASNGFPHTTRNVPTLAVPFHVLATKRANNLGPRSWMYEEWRTWNLSNPCSFNLRHTDTSRVIRKQHVQDYSICSPTLKSNTWKRLAGKRSSTPPTASCSLPYWAIWFCAVKSADACNKPLFSVHHA